MFKFRWGVVVRLVVVVILFVFLAEPLLANYRSAQAYFQRRDYVTAASAFYNALASTSKREIARKSEWGLAQSLQKLEFYYSASKYYSDIVRRGPSGKNPFFKSALEQLGKVNSRVQIGQSQVVKLFRKGINVGSVPRSARGFFYYYQGLESFKDGRRSKALKQFAKVPSNSSYYDKARFHMGVVAAAQGKNTRAIQIFESVRRRAPSGERGEFVRELTNLNIARIKYGGKKYRDSLRYYRFIPRDSDNWLQSLFEASWAFFMLQKHNNVLGNSHTILSPFFINRFYPEIYILKAITYLKMCDTKKVRKSVNDFQRRYKPIFNDIRDMLRAYRDDYRGFYKLITDYRRGRLRKYRKASSILDHLMRTDSYKEGVDTTRFSDRELARLSRVRRWGSSGLRDELEGFLRGKKSLAAKDAGRRLFRKATGFFKYLKELSEQTIRIKTEMLLKDLDDLRKELNIPVKGKKGDFIGGLQPLKVGQKLEYWPFEGEYWEDELGYYVYNIESKCGKKRKKKK